MALKSMTAWKFILPAGLLLVLVQGLLQVAEFQDYLFPGKHFRSELEAVGDKCLLMETDLISLRGRVQDLEAFLASQTPDRRPSGASLVLSPWSEGVRFFFPKFFWNVNIYQAKRTRVKVERNVRYVDSMLNNLELMKPKFPQNSARQFSLNHGPDFQIQKIRARCQFCASEVKRLSEKLNSLVERGKDL